MQQITRTPTAYTAAQVDMMRRAQKAGGQLRIRGPGEFRIARNLVRCGAVRLEPILYAGAWVHLTSDGYVGLRRMDTAEPK